MDGAQVKIGIYNLYWSTFGGGEQQAGGIADALSAEHEVELIGPDAIDLDYMRERLGLQLAGVTFRRIVADEYAAALASADYDVFVNHTYRSVAPCLAPVGLYFVMFPHPFTTSALHGRMRTVGARFASSVRFLSGVGRNPRNGCNELQGPALVQMRGGVRTLTVELQTTHPEDVISAVVPSRSTTSPSVSPDVPVLQRQRVDGTTVIQFHLPGDELGQVLLSPVILGEDREVANCLRVVGVRADGVAVDAAERTLRERLMGARQNAFLDSYQMVVALSEYTLGWTRTWWGRGEAVVSPPVTMREPGDKSNLIVSVGRFFDERSGHSKRQLDLVRAFRRMVEDGLRDWRLVLIGGCSPADREYAMKVRHEARGLPVEVRLSAPGSVLDEHLAAASIYWHGAGLGSDLALHPDRAEHFGIAPIEAMSAGAVPVVFAAAGPAEVVQHEVNGLHFHDLDELVRQTRRLIDDPELRTRLATAAVDRAHEYDRSHFQTTVRDTVARLIAQASPG